MSLIIFTLTTYHTYEFFYFLLTSILFCLHENGIITHFRQHVQRFSIFWHWSFFIDIQTISNKSSSTIQILFSVSGDVPREVGGTFLSQRECAKVTEWLSVRFGGSDVTSGVDSMSISASDVEMLDQSLPKGRHSF